MLLHGCCMSSPKALLLKENSVVHTFCVFTNQWVRYFVSMLYTGTLQSIDHRYLCKAYNSEVAYCDNGFHSKRFEQGVICSSE